MSKYRRFFTSIRDHEIQVTADGPSQDRPQMPTAICIHIEADDDGNECQVTLSASDAMQLREMLADALKAAVREPANYSEMEPV